MTTIFQTGTEVGSDIEEQDLTGSPIVGSEGTSPTNLARQFSR